MLGGAGGGGAMGQFPLEQWFYEMPACTRYWTTATILTSVLVQCHVITPFQLFYSFRAVFVKNQVNIPPNEPLITYHTEKADGYTGKVLATDNDLPLLRALIPRPPLPRLLPPALLPPPRRIIRSIPGSVLMAARLRHYPPTRPLTHAQHTLSRIRPLEFAGVYMEPEEPGDEVEFFGSARLHGAVSAVGFDGVQSGVAWDRAEG